MGLQHTVEIEKMVYGGSGMGRINGKVVFVPFTAPGDRLQVEVTQEKKDFVEALGTQLITPSPLRTQPFCSLFGKCGGCQYQHLAYSDQLKIKEEILKESLRRLTKEDGCEIFPILPSSHDRGYRIRVQLKGGQCKGKEVLGFYGPKTHQVVDVQECALLHPLANQILRNLREWLGGKREKFWIQGANLQVSPDEGKGVMALHVEGNVNAASAEMLGMANPVCKGVVIENKQKIIWGEVFLVYNGSAAPEQKALKIAADYKSFTQVNPFQNENLTRKLIEWSGLTGKEKVLDLYCGSGNLSLPLAQWALRVWGVDQDPAAITYARKNALGNYLDNTTFLTGTAQDGIKKVLTEAQAVDLAVLDPPRAGAGEILNSLALLCPRKILYVSCEPPTLIRDLVRLRRLGYHLIRIQPLDMFPHTYHIEVIAELSKGLQGSRGKNKNLKQNTDRGGE
ncbi:MAG: 23S rRNA (uracil(1939)-C(5))-methyltransferase RlmD [Deltaproteobacteria bacterium]|nr:23S rRNA (uracil(1939)-C(5))-methyltransferase RlmD [Deltaproteobacteria bacterium]